MLCQDIARDMDLAVVMVCADSRAQCGVRLQGHGFIRMTCGPGDNLASPVKHCMKELLAKIRCAHYEKGWGCDFKRIEPT